MTTLTEREELAKTLLQERHPSTGPIRDAELEEFRLHAERGVHNAWAAMLVEADDIIAAEHRQEVAELVIRDRYPKISDHALAALRKSTAEGFHTPWNDALATTDVIVRLGFTRTVTKDS